MDAKQNGQLMIFGKKLVQLREAVAALPVEIVAQQLQISRSSGNAQGIFLWPQLVKSCGYAGSVLEGVASSFPPDAAVLAVSPAEKIWMNPTAFPDLCNSCLNMEISKSGVSGDSAFRSHQNQQEFLRRLKQFTEEKILELGDDAGASQPKSKSEKFPVPKEIVNIFKTTSAQRRNLPVS
jgi:hypothetical protein